MTSWDDWWHVMDWVEGAGHTRVVDLAVAATPVTGTVAQEPDQTMHATMTTTDPVLAVSDPASATEVAPTVSFDEYRGGYAGYEAQYQMDELWPGARPSDIRLIPGSDVKGASEVHATRSGAPPTVTFDAVSTWVNDVKEG